MSLTSLALLLTPLSSILSSKTILASWHHPSSQVVSTPPPPNLRPRPLHPSSQSPRPAMTRTCRVRERSVQYQRQGYTSL